ncbi:MAG: FAD-binding oxidoreductase [Propionibacteriaceae bacterium]|jgi:alkyldihydroxyacetonephosphate synthase|nr:FAD-binding oxidoreductase [Propionibacteriaceae bacterium]
MEVVKHQKWWGWGEDGIEFTYEDKPKFADFVLTNVGVDVTAAAFARPDFEAVQVAAPQLKPGFRKVLVGIVGEDWVATDKETRLVHACGRGVVDLIRLRRGELGRVPDVVVYPADEAEIVALMEAVVKTDAVLIPYGGGSNIVGALTAPRTLRTVISVDMGRLNQVMEIDPTSGLARIQAGVLGPDLEEQLNAQGWTMGHFPDSFIWSTLGGWIATRSSGMQSDKYGDIADMTRGLRLVTPEGVMVLRPLPSTASGPSVREMVLGSEGRLGIITEAWMNVHRRPAVRTIQGYFFATYNDGLAAMAAIAASDAAPSITRVMDAAETAFSIANGKKSSTVTGLANKAVQRLMTMKGWRLDEVALGLVGFEGTRRHVAYEKGLVDAIISRHRGLGVGTSPGALYDQKKYDVPYIRDFLLDRGIPADVSETATPWQYTTQLHDATVAAAYRAMAEAGVQGFVMCHLSHSYHSGACQYFTFALNDSSDRMLETYRRVKGAIQQSFMDNHGTVSHHHGGGSEQVRWLGEDISAVGVSFQAKLFSGVDPGGWLNPAG